MLKEKVTNVTGNFSRSAAVTIEYVYSGKQGEKSVINARYIQQILKLDIDILKAG